MIIAIILNNPGMDSIKDDTMIDIARYLKTSQASPLIVTNKRKLDKMRTETLLNSGIDIVSRQEFNSGRIKPNLIHCLDEKSVEYICQNRHKFESPIAKTYISQKIQKKKDIIGATISFDNCYAGKYVAVEPVELVLAEAYKSEKSNSKYAVCSSGLNKSIIRDAERICEEMGMKVMKLKSFHTKNERIARLKGAQAVIGVSGTRLIKEAIMLRKNTIEYYQDENGFVIRGVRGSSNKGERGGKAMLLITAYKEIIREYKKKTSAYVNKRKD